MSSSETIDANICRRLKVKIDGFLLKRNEKDFRHEAKKNVSFYKVTRTSHSWTIGSNKSDRFSFRCKMFWKEKKSFSDRKRNLFFLRIVGRWVKELWRLIWAFVQLEQRSVFRVEHFSKISIEHFPPNFTTQNFTVEEISRRDNSSKKSTRNLSMKPNRPFLMSKLLQNLERPNKENLFEEKTKNIFLFDLISFSLPPIPI